MRVQAIFLLLCMGLFTTVAGSCPNPPTITSGTITCDNGNLTGSRCVVECENGYSFAGSNEVTDEIACSEDGTWEKIFPKCTEKCPPKADIVFVVDFSTSTAGAGRRLMRGFLKQFVERLNISNDAINVAAVPFSKNVTLHRVVHLNNFTDNKRALLKSLRKLGLPRGGSTTGKALNYVNQVILTTENGNRDDAPDFVIVLSDGRGQGHIDHHLSSMWDSGVTTYAVGFHPREGMQILEHRLLKIAQGDRSRMHITEKKAGLKAARDLADRLGKAYCVESVTRCNVNPAFTPVNGSVVCTNYNKVGSTCTFECDEGLVIVGEESLQCLAGKDINEWTGEFPKCAQKCQEISIKNGQSVCSSAANVGSVCSSECNPGYILTGPHEITCIELEEGSAWNSAPPRCIDRELDLELLKRSFPRSCSPTQPAAPLNGSVSCTNDNEIGSECTFNCNEGFILEGDSKTICIERGKGALWTMTTPYCVEKCTSTLTISPANGGVECSDNNDIGSECSFHCNDGYFILGPLTTECQRTGKRAQWSNNPPECYAACVPRTPPAPSNGGVICTGENEIGSICTFYCKDGYDLDGPSSTTCSEGATGAAWSSNESPQCIIRCPESESTTPANGYSICSGSSEVGSICTFMCEFGYSMIGPEKIVCEYAEIGAAWSAEPPICAATCYPPLPVTPRNGFVSCTNRNEIGSSCTYECEEDFVLIGQENSECVSRGVGAIWSSQAPICKETCRAIKIAPYKGTVICTKGGNVGSVCEFSCQDGYSLKGVSNIACLDRGKGPFWSADLPICIARCGEDVLPDPENGKVTCSEENQLGSVCSYTCHDGYSIVGSRRVECINDGDKVAWNSVGPSCLANCQPLALDSLTNGLVICSRGSHIGSVCHFVCKNGYRLVGQNIVECATVEGVAVWDKEIPACIARCSPSRPISPINGDVECSNENEVGSVCKFMCTNGYSLVAHETTECVSEKNGAFWNRGTPSCVAKCGDSPPASPQKGSVTCTNGNELGSVCTYFCNDGQTLIGEVTSVCVKDHLGARWSSQAPTCVAICGVKSPQTPINGKVSCTRGGKLDSICEFSCVNGYSLVGDHIIECARHNDGAKWTANAPTCQAKCTPTSPPTPANGNVICSNSNEMGSVCKYTCQSGYTVMGNDITKCIKQGTGAVWSSELPRCTATCNPEELQSPNNGNYECTDDNNIGSVCTFYCDDKYDLVGSKNMVCMDKEMGVRWSSSSPSCIARCSPLHINNGAISCTDGNEIGSICTYECEPGYDLAGEGTTKCTERAVGATWNQQAPGCNARCSVYPSKPRKGNVACTKKNRLDSFCSFTCDDGFLLIGMPNTTCVELKSKARWSNAFPKCVARCTLPSSPVNGRVSCTKHNEVGSVCTYSCNRVYSLVGDRTSKCIERENGATWSVQPATCAASCGSNLPRAPVNGMVKCTNGNAVNSVCTFSCRKGHTLFGSRHTTCNENTIGASWDQTTPACLATCSKDMIQPRRGVKITCSKGNDINSICKFVCDKEYSLIGHARLRCIERNKIASWDRRRPYCVRKCLPEMPPAPGNGSVTCNQGNEIGSVCTYTCNEKHSLIGSSTTKCARQRGQGSWDKPTPRCAGDCTRILTIKPAKGRVMCTNSNRAGSICSFSCDTGLSLAGSRRTVCVDDGSKPHWSEESPECVAPCSPVIPKRPENGGVACTDRNQVGSICTFRCRSGFRLDGDLWTNCISKGGKSSWDDANPSCVVRCESEPTAPPNGEVSCTRGSKLGSRCIFTCNSGYVLTGVPSTTCVKRGYSTRWSTSTPRCTPVCDGVNTLRPQHGNVQCRKGNRIGSVCQFKCDEGYGLEGPETTTCTSRLGVASWSAERPTCIVRCPSLSASSKGLISSCTNGGEVGSVCTFQCQPGSELSGGDEIFCVKRGISLGAMWSRSPPSCIEKCYPATPLAPNNGTVTCRNGNQVDSICRFECEPGLYIVGKSWTKCTKNLNRRAEWDADAPICTAKCADLSTIRPENGVVFCTAANDIDSICSFECGPRYSLNGASVTKCVDGAIWSHPSPICEPTCYPKRPTTPYGGSTRCTESNELDSVCTFQCGRNRVLQGNKITTCVKRDERSAHWDKAAPKCVAVCTPQSPTPPIFGRVTCTNTNRAGSVCTFTCNRGYMLLGRHQTTCSARRNVASWRRAWKRCIKKCPVLDSPTYGKMTCTDGNEKGSICSFSCGTHLEIVGAPKTTCMVRGIKTKWSKSPPTCFGLCESGIPKAPENGRIVCTDKNEVGSTCTFQCNLGFSPVGNRTTRCMTDETGLYWTKATTRCIQEKCFPPREFLEHGTVSCSDENNVGSVCKFECTKGAYKLYPPRLDTNVCRDTIGTSVNSWNNVAPCCARQCPPMAKMDAVIALDSSSSIGMENWQIMMTFIENIIRAFEISKESANFAVFRYNADIDKDSEILFKDFPNNKAGLVKAFRKIPYSGSGTNTGKALQHISDNVLTAEAGDRPNVTNVVIVVTDGTAADDISGPAQFLRSKGAEIFVIGIVPPRGLLDLRQLRELAGDDSNIQIATGGFQQLNFKFARRIASKVCGNPCER